MRVVLDLTQDLQGRNVTCDNFFTTHQLGCELLKRKLTMVGTVRKNKAFLPLNAVNTKQKPVCSSEFFFDHTNNITLVSYIPKKNRCVNLLSTLHHKIEISNDNQKKPEIIKFYNKTKCGVDVLDQLIGTYSCKRRTNRWPMVLFSNMLDISAYNGFVIWTEIYPSWNNNKKYKRRLFLEDLGFALINPEIERRPAKSHDFCAKTYQENIQSANTKDKQDKPSLKRARCFMCPQLSNSTKFSTKCNKCNKFICKVHSNIEIKCKKCEELQ